MGKKKSNRINKTVFVQNLPFKAEEKDLLEKFKQFGEIKKCFIVKSKINNNETKSKGVGYVIFKNEESCKKCLEGKMKVKVGTRRVRLSEAKPRVREEGFKELKKGESESEKEEEIDNKIKINDSITIFETKRKNEKEEEITIEEEYEENDEKEKAIEEKYEENDEEEIEEDGEEEEVISKSEEQKEEKEKQQRIKKNDTEEGKTLFIKNLSFDAVEDDLEELFQKYGSLNYCRVVINPKTDYSQGTAFIKFREKKFAENCLAAFEENSDNFILQGRKLVVLKALTKEQAKKVQVEREVESTKSSNKNLHLIRLTLIRPGTKAAEGVSKEDLNKRAKVEMITRSKLKNPNIFVSSTRLCIRNIPPSITDPQLKKIFLKAAANKNAYVKECRIMRDLKRPNSEGVCKSRGYGFIEFTKHEDALAAVLATNNNPSIFSTQRRPIVEFSLENKSALEMKQKRAVQSKLSLVVKSKNANPEVVKKLRKEKQKFKYPGVAPNLNPKMKALPSHKGPKNRKRNRGKEVKKSKEIKTKFNSGKEKQLRKRQRPREERDHIDKMVSDYKKKFSSLSKLR